MYLCAITRKNLFVHFKTVSRVPAGESFSRERRRLIDWSPPRWRVSCSVLRPCAASCVIVTHFVQQLRSHANRGDIKKTALVGFVAQKPITIGFPFCPQVKTKTLASHFAARSDIQAWISRNEKRGERGANARSTAERSLANTEGNRPEISCFRFTVVTSDTNLR